MRKTRSRQHGFTLIELLTTLCIASVLAIIGMPALGSMLAHSHTLSARKRVGDWPRAHTRNRGRARHAGDRLLQRGCPALRRGR